MASAASDPARSDLAHLLRRAGFGARPAELDAAVKAGYRATVESLLSGLSGPDPGGDAVTLPDLTLPNLSPPVAGAPVAGAPVAGAPAGGAPAGGGPTTDPIASQAAAKQRRQAERQAQNQEYLALQRWWLNRMIATSTPLREKLTLVWHGHFATAFAKVRVASLMHQQNQLFRTLGGGNFEALAQAVAKDPAMMIWLDTETDVASHPNENFARELMELFTLGIGNYSEDDVQAGARAFTGWGLSRPEFQFVLRPRRHDSRTKTFLGQSGDFDGTDIVRIVTHRPESAGFVTARLWSHLAYPVATTDPVVADLAPGYARDLDIGSLVRAILLHPGFTSAAAKQGLVKQPIEWVVGVARAFGLDADLQPTTGGRSGGTAGTAGGGSVGSGGSGAAGRSPLSAILTLLAQEPFNPPNVGGWPQNGYWLNTASSLARLQAALSVALHVDTGALDALPAAQRPGALASQLSIDGWGPTTMAALNHVASAPKALIGLALTAPEYVLN